MSKNLSIPVELCRLNGWGGYINYGYMALAGSCARACDLGSAQAGNHGFARMGKIIIEILKAGGAMQGLRSARYQCSSTNIRENP